MLGGTVSLFNNADHKTPLKKQLVKPLDDRVDGWLNQD